MKYTIITIAFVAAFASAQLDGFPSCGVPCLTSARGDSKCGMTDIKCACQDQPLIERVSQCIQQSCSEADQQAALDAAKKLCEPFGTDVGHEEPTPSEGSAPEPTGEGQPTEKVPPPPVASTGGALPAPTNNGSYTPPVETQAPNSGAPNQASVAFGLAGLSLLAAAFVL